MAEFPALPLFTDAVVADCYHLNDDEFGKYMRILILMWRTPLCRIPADPNWISKRINCDALAYAKHIQPIVQEFCTLITEDGEKFWIQKRLRKEYEYVRDLSQKRSKAAKKRWSKDQGTENKQKHTKQSMEQNVSKADAPTPTPTPTPLYKKDISKDISQKAEEVDEIKTAVMLYNEMAERAGLAQAQKISQARKTSLKARLKDAGGIEGWKIALQKVEKSEFCKGKNDRGWKVDFDFLVRESSFIKIMEGKYDEKHSTKSSGKSQAGDLREQASALLEKFRD